MKQSLINHFKLAAIKVFKKWYHMPSKFIDEALNFHGKYVLTPINIIRNHPKSNIIQLIL